MKIPISFAVLLVFMLGCASATHTKRNSSLIDGVDIAVNLGDNYGDLDKLEDALASGGMAFGERAISLNAGGIVVERSDFERAKILVTRTIVQDRLTVRVYESPDFAKAPATSLLEVWVKGEKIGEETKWKIARGGVLPGASPKN